MIGAIPLNDVARININGETVAKITIAKNTVLIVVNATRDLLSLYNTCYSPPYHNDTLETLLLILLTKKINEKLITFLKRLMAVAKLNWASPMDFLKT